MWFQTASNPSLRQNVLGRFINRWLDELSITEAGSAFCTMRKLITTSKNLVSPRASHVLLEVIYLLTHTMSRWTLYGETDSISVTLRHSAKKWLNSWKWNAQKKRRKFSVHKKTFFVSKNWLIDKSTITKMYFLHPNIWA